MERVVSWWSQVPVVWRGVIVLSSALAAGWSGGVWVTSSRFVLRAEFVELHSVVDSLRSQVSTLQSNVTVNTATMDRLEVSVDEVRDLMEDIRLNTCLTLMEVRGDSNTDRCQR